jgi:hypothetical protein
MKLWNFQTEQYDTVAAITDGNVFNYMPANHILENRYEALRNKGEIPLDAYNAIMESHHVWN